MKQKYKAIGILLVGIILLIVYLCGGIKNLNKNETITQNSCPEKRAGAS